MARVAGIGHATVMGIVVAGRTILVEPEKALLARGQNVYVSVVVARLAAKLVVGAGKSESQPGVVVVGAPFDARQGEAARGDELDLAAVVLDVAERAARSHIASEIAVEPGILSKLLVDLSVTVSTRPSQRAPQGPVAQVAALLVLEVWILCVSRTERTGRRAPEVEREEREHQ